MSWFIVSIVSVIKYNHDEQSEFPVFEDFFLFSAGSRAELDRKIATEIEIIDGAGKCFYNRIPSAQSCIGVRKIRPISNEPPYSIDENPPGDGTELTQSFFLVGSINEAMDLAAGKRVTVIYPDEVDRCEPISGLIHSGGKRVVHVNESMGMTIFQNRPKSEDELSSILQEAYRYAIEERNEEALRICDWLMEDPATLVAGMRERATIRDHMNDFDGAIEDYRHLIAMNTDRPGDYYDLGMLLLRVENPAEAIGCFSKAIALGEAADFHFYTNSSLLHRAEAELRIGNWQSAKLDCQRLPAGYKEDVYDGLGMLTREEILSEVHELETGSH